MPFSTSRSGWMPTAVARLLPATLVLACPGAGCSSSDPAAEPERPEGCDRPDPYAEEFLKADIAYLASPALDGRRPGTQGEAAARAFIAERFECIGLSPLGDDGPYLQAFTNNVGAETYNVLGWIEGTDAAVSAESIVLAAHYDHLGEGHLGANDNASGVAALMAIAQQLLSGPAPRRSILFAAFGSEEPQSPDSDIAFEGSEWFYTNPPGGVNRDGIVHVVNMDMLGTYSQAGVLEALGTFDGAAGADVVASLAPKYPSLDVVLGNPSDQSDHVSFCARGIPYVFFWTDDPDCYHDTCDTSDRIDYPSLASITALAGDTALALANSQQDLAAAVRPGVDVCSTP